MKEKRTAVRLSVDIPVKIRYNGITHPARSRNLSCGGIFVQTPQAPLTEAPQESCDVILSLPDGQPPMMVSTRVVWQVPEAAEETEFKEEEAHPVEAEAAADEPAAEPEGEEGPGAGMQFQDLDPEAKARINAFIEKTMRENLH